MTHPDNTTNGELTRLAHCCRQGRARLEVAGLYRTPRLKKLLEKQLAEISGIENVNASTLTGRVLVIFNPAVELDDIARHIEALLTDTPSRGFKSKASPGIPSFKVAQTLSGFSALLRGLPSLLTPAPAYAMAAGVHTDDFQEIPRQEI